MRTEEEEGNSGGRLLGELRALHPIRHLEITFEDRSYEAAAHVHIYIFSSCLFVERMVVSRPLVLGGGAGEALVRGAGRVGRAEFFDILNWEVPSDLGQVT